MQSSSLLIVEPSQLFREGLRKLMLAPPYAAVSAVRTAEESLDSISAFQPDLVLLGPGSKSCIPAEVAWVRERHSGPGQVRFVMLIDATDVDWPQCVADSGIDAVLSQDISAEVLHRSLDLVMLGQRFFPAVLAHAPAEREPATLIPFPKPSAARMPVTDLDVQRGATLSEREATILRCLMDGASNKVIARELQVTEATVKAHVKGLLRKVRASNRTQAAVWAFNNNVQVLEALGQVTSLPPAGALGRRVF